MMHANIGAVQSLQIIIGWNPV